MGVLGFDWRSRLGDDMTTKPDIEGVMWFGGNEEPDFEDGARFYADGSVRVPTQDEIDANRKRMRRFYFVQNQAKRQHADPHEWRDRDGWRMVVVRHSRIIRDGDDYRDAFQACITHPERARSHFRYIKTRMFPYRELAVAEGLELLTAHRLRRRARVGREMRAQMAAEHGQAGRALSATFLRNRKPEIPVGFRR